MRVLFQRRIIITLLSGLVAFMNSYIFKNGHFSLTVEEIFASILDFIFLLYLVAGKSKDL